MSATILWYARSRKILFYKFCCKRNSLQKIRLPSELTYKGVTQRCWGMSWCPDKKIARAFTHRLHLNIQLLLN